MDNASNITLVLFVINALFAIAGWSMKSMITDLKAEVVKNRSEIDIVKEKYYKKEDFQEFKKELWQRLDKFEQDVKEQLHAK